MRAYIVIFLVWVSLFAVPQAFAQTATPMPESVERRLQQACSVDVIEFIDAICHDKGTVNTVAINFPGVCKRYDYSNDIKRKLQECDGKNVFFEMWKFKFNIQNDFEEKFVEYVEKYFSNEAASGSNSIASAYEAFRLSVWACGLDAACHRSLFDLFPKQMKLSFEQTPYFCDYSPSVPSFNDAPYKHMFFRENYPDGVAQPMCRAYYCKYKDCSAENSNGELFILSDKFRPHYDLLYKAIQP